MRQIARQIAGASALLLCLGILTGCGDESGTGPEPAASLGACESGDEAITGGTDLAEVDLDGDGTPDKLRASAGEPCPDVVFAETGVGLVAGEVPGEQRAEDIRVLTVPGLAPQLFSTLETSPRGGFQVRVYALDGSTIMELQHEGASVVPFVATDVTGLGTSARCDADATIVIRSTHPDATGKVTVTDQPYAIAGASVTAAEPVTLAEGLTEQQVATRFPDVAGNEMFTNC